jgi:predicted Zn-dependent protease
MTRRKLSVLALALCVATTSSLACASKPKLEKDAQGRTILLSEADAVPVDEPRRKRQDVLLTKADDARVGRQGAEAVAASIGLLGDADLDAYLQALGEKLLRGVPRTFDFQFRVVDQVEPNAFALPGGYIFVSRGLLALATSEDELANVVGHEIAHVTLRHAATRQAIDRARGFALPWIRAGQDAAYSRDMERQADREGQQLAAAAGYDPMALSTFLAALGQDERLRRGLVRVPGMFDTHPGTTERVGSNSMRAGEIRWHADPARGDTHRAYLEQIEGLPWGDRPEGGIFRGQRFLHPVLDFQMRFPDGWRTVNSAAAVAALSPDRLAQVFLEPGEPAESATAAARQFRDEVERETQDVKVRAFEPVTVAGSPGARLEIVVGGRVHAIVTFFSYRDGHYRITGATPAGRRSSRDLLLATMRSFRPLNPELARGIQEEHVRLATARSGETLSALCERAGCAKETVPPTAVMNRVTAADRWDGGELVKIIRSEDWTPPRR